MKSTRKPSMQPPLWMLFGAGGMLSALVGAALVFVTGLAAPLGILLPADALSYPHVLAFARNPLGKAFAFAVVSLFLWHAAHRIYHTLHDFGIHPGLLQWLACYGVALAATLIAALSLLSIGF
jgi:succinate dehydrogenase subunit D